ncbi:hypothetical protein O3M35_003563 [Rhynocoris fuscipes]|uniref:Vacuolar ATPase assembly integral membrane protein VMA21 n=1 Tax=Rhynocoris fuscipes TaxID=488301 RepID=A0AAW1CJC6_9HEMI
MCSIAMFTLPFIAFFGAQRIVTYFGGGDFTKLACSVIASVLVVNIIIFTYVWHAFNEVRQESILEREEQERLRQSMQEHSKQQ